MDLRDTLEVKLVEFGNSLNVGAKDRRGKEWLFDV